MDLTDQLLSLAQKSDQQAKYAAIIYHRNKIVGLGHNYLIADTTKKKYCLLRG
mgnify:CR=1 FL=1